VQIAYAPHDRHTSNPRRAHRGARLSPRQSRQTAPVEVNIPQRCAQVMLLSTWLRLGRLSVEVAEYRGRQQALVSIPAHTDRAGWDASRSAGPRTNTAGHAPGHIDHVRVIQVPNLYRALMRARAGDLQDGREALRVGAAACGGRPDLHVLEVARTRARPLFWAPSCQARL